MGNAKQIKANGIFRKPIPVARFQKRYLASMEQPRDRQFLESAFVAEGGAMTLRKDMSPQDIKRLNKLAPFIRSKGAVLKPAPLLALGAIAVGITVFGLAFMNPLIESGMEAGLQAMFGARAEVTGLAFKPFAMKLSIEALRVADAQSPMTNLFELGRTELRLNPSAALRGKVYVEEASVSGIAIGTPRKESGALPEAPAPVVQEKAPRPEAPPLVDFGRFDAKALLEGEKAKLASTKAYRESAAAYEAALTRWDDRRTASSAALGKAQENASALLALDPKSIRTVDQAAKALNDVKAALVSAQAVATEANTIRSGMERDAATLKALGRDASSAVDSDMAYLKALIDPGSGAALKALEPSLRALLSDSAERYLEYGKKLYDALQALKTYGGPSADRAAATSGKKTYPPSSRGRVVRYEGTRYPAFRLGLVSAGIKTGSADWELALHEISSDPQLVPAPSSLDLALRGKDGKSVHALAEAFLSSADGRAYRVDLSLEGLPFDLGAALADVGLDGFSGTLQGSVALSGNKDLSADADFRLIVGGARIARPSGTIGTAIAKAAAKAGGIRANGSWSTDGKGGEAFTFSTDIAALVEAALRDMAASYANEAKGALERELRRYVSEELASSLGSKESFDAILAAANGDASSGDKLKKSLEAKLKELEAQAKNLGAGILQGIAVPKIGP